MKKCLHLLGEQSETTSVNGEKYNHSERKHSSSSCSKTKMHFSIDGELSRGTKLMASQDFVNGQISSRNSLKLDACRQRSVVFYMTRFTQEYSRGGTPHSHYGAPHEGEAEDLSYETGVA